MVQRTAFLPDGDPAPVALALSYEAHALLDHTGIPGVVPGGGETLAQTLILGNNTGANDISVDSGQAVTGLGNLALQGYGRIGTATDAVATGDFSAGLVGANRIFYDQSTAILLSQVDADNRIQLAAGSGSAVGINRAVAGGTTYNTLTANAWNSVGAGVVGLGSRLIAQAETSTEGTLSGQTTYTSIWRDPTLGAEYAQLEFGVKRNTNIRNLLVLGNSASATGNARAEFGDSAGTLVAYVDMDAESLVMGSTPTITLDGATGDITAGGLVWDASARTLQVTGITASGLHHYVEGTYDGNINSQVRNLSSGVSAAAIYRARNNLGDDIFMGAYGSAHSVNANTGWLGTNGLELRITTGGDDAIVFETFNVDRWTIQNNTDGGHLLPASGSTYNLGSNASRVAAVFADRTNIGTVTDAVGTGDFAAGLSGSNTLVYDASSASLALSGTGPTLRVGASHNATDAEANIVAIFNGQDAASTAVRLGSAGTGVTPFFASQHSRGTFASPTAVADGDQVGGFVARGYIGATTEFNPMASFRGYADGTPTDTSSAPGRLVFATTPSGSLTLTDRWQVNNAGHLSAVPGDDNTYDFGSSDGGTTLLRPRTIYVGTSLIGGAEATTFTFSAPAATTAATDGGSLAFTAGAANTTGEGGSISLTSGGPGTADSGFISIQSANTGTSGSSGMVSIFAGENSGSGDGGVVSVYGGQCESHAVGARIDYNGASRGVQGGDLDLFGGTATASGVNGGAISLTGGNAGTGAATGGGLVFTTGDGGGTSGNSGSITMDVGSVTSGTTGSISIGATNASSVTIDSTGVLELNSSGGVISIGNDAVAQNINIGTGAAARTITIGNTTGAAALALDSGTGAIDIGTSVAKTITIGNTTGATGIAYDAGSGGHSFTGDMGVFGASPVGQSAAYTRNATVVESRTLLASASATTTNNNNVLAALIADLQAFGVLG